MATCSVSVSFPVVPSRHGLPLVSSRHMAGPQGPLCALGLFPPQLPGDSPSFFRGLPGAPGREGGYREKFQIHQCMLAEIEKVKLTHGPGCDCRVVGEPELGPRGTGALEGLTEAGEPGTMRSNITAAVLCCAPVMCQAEQWASCVQDPLFFPSVLWCGCCHPFCIDEGVRAQRV